MEPCGSFLRQPNEMTNSVTAPLFQKCLAHCRLGCLLVGLPFFLFQQEIIYSSTWTAESVRLLPHYVLTFHSAIIYGVYGRYVRNLRLISWHYITYLKAMLWIVCFCEIVSTAFMLKIQMYSSLWWSDTGLFISDVLKNRSDSVLKGQTVIIKTYAVLCVVTARKIWFCPQMKRINFRFGERGIDLYYR